MVEGWSFNPPSHWPRPPRGWTPPPGWEPDPGWGPMPPGWQLWVPTPPSRYPWPAVLCATGVIALFAAAVTWLPQMSEAALVSATDLQAGADIDNRPSDSGNGPIPAGTLTPALPKSLPSDVPMPTPSILATSLTAATAPRFDSCAALTAVYPHGVGMPEAVDQPGRYRDVKRPVETSLPRSYRVDENGGWPDGYAPTRPKVTAFGRSTALYGANRPLDTDRDGIACER